MSPTNRLRVFVAAAVLGVLAAGCSNDALDRRDKAALTTGNGVASNIAIHTDDPWPPNVNKTEIPGSGKRGHNIMKKYNKGPEAAPTAAPDTDVTVVMPPPVPVAP